MLATKLICNFLSRLFAKTIEDNEAFLAKVNVKHDKLSSPLSCWWFVTVLRVWTLLIIIGHVSLSLQLLRKTYVPLLHFLIVILRLCQSYRLLLRLKLFGNWLGRGRSLVLWLELSNWLGRRFEGLLRWWVNKWIRISGRRSMIKLFSNWFFARALALRLSKVILNLVRYLFVSQSILLNLILRELVQNFLILLQKEAIVWPYCNSVSRFDWSLILAISQRHSKLDISLDMVNLSFFLKLISHFVIACQWVSVHIRQKLWGKLTHAWSTWFLLLHACLFDWRFWNLVQRISVNIREKIWSERGVSLFWLNCVLLLKRALICLWGRLKYLRAWSWHYWRVNVVVYERFPLIWRPTSDDWGSGSHGLWSVFPVLQRVVWIFGFLNDFRNSILSKLHKFVLLAILSWLPLNLLSVLCRGYNMILHLLFPFSFSDSYFSRWRSSNTLDLSLKTLSQRLSLILKINLFDFGQCVNSNLRIFMIVHTENLELDTEFS